MQAALIGALNGVIGDYLQNTENPLAVELSFYHEGKPIASLFDSAQNYADEYQEWNGSLCIFLHGAAGSESAWMGNLPAGPDPTETKKWSYGCDLYNEFQIMPVYIRYNSGLHISQNGKALSELLEKQLHHQKIKKVFIIGHSMGGLVFRSACHYADGLGFTWMNKIEQVYYLGSPHLGAPLEKFGAWTQSILQKVNSRYTQIAAKLIDIRSNGIKDLRHGYLIDEEWIDDEKHDFPVNNRRVHYHLESARHLLVAGTLNEDPNSFTAQWFGDIMVSQSSATSNCKYNKFNLPVKDEDIFVTGGHHHIKLMQSIEVYDFIRSKIREAL